MGDLLFIIVSTNGLTQRVVISQQQSIPAASGSVYAILDASSEEIPDGLVLRRKGDNLSVEVDGEVIVEIQDFYTANMDATFSTNGSLTPSRSPVVSDARLSEGSDVVWSANDVVERVTTSVDDAASSSVESLIIEETLIETDTISEATVERDVNTERVPTATTADSESDGLGMSTLAWGAGGAALLGLALSGGGGGGGSSSSNSLTVNITDNITGTANGDVTYTFTFNKVVTGFTIDDITVVGGTKGGFTAASGTEYTLVVTPELNSTTSITVDVAADVAMDTPGNNNLAARQSVQPVDTLPPTVVISMADTSLTLGESSTVTFTFSEAPAGFTIANITVENGTLSELIVDGNNPAVYTATFTPDAGIEDTSNVISVDAAYTDVVGNTGAGGSSENYEVDGIVPILISFTPADDSTQVSQDTNIVLNFSENIAIGTGNIVISGDSEVITIDVGDSSQVSITDNVLTINPTADLAQKNVTYNVQLAAGVITDVTGNSFAGIEDETTFSFTTVNDVVVFDLTSGLSSDHSEQSFQSGISYTIYIKVNSDNGSISLDDGEMWGGAENLASDDRIVLVGTGSAIKGLLGASVESFNQNAFFGLDRSQWRTNSFPAFILAENGGVNRFLNQVANEDLWTGSWASQPNNGLGLSQIYLTTMPGSVIMPT